MTTKRALGIVIAIVALITGSFILIDESSVIEFFSAVGITLAIVSVITLCIWLIMDDE